MTTAPTTSTSSDEPAVTVSEKTSKPSAEMIEKMRAGLIKSLNSNNKNASDDEKDEKDEKDENK